MAAIWDDRLAEVWAPPGKAGSGVVIGTEMVLTARHVVAGAPAGRGILSRVVKPGAVTAAWVPMTLLAADEAWDVALLGVDYRTSGRDAGSGPEWLKPSSPAPVFVRLGTSAEHGCEAVGFPQSEVQSKPEGDPVTTVRQSEQSVGTLLPSGQAKKPVSPERPLPTRWMPFDVDEPPPVTQAGWGGMSGAGVVLADGRLAGLVVDAESGHQERRLYAVPFSGVLAESDPLAGALAAALGGPVVIELRDAPLYRDVLEDDCLAPDGMPMRVGQASYKAFGAKAAGVPGEPAYLDYVPRDADQTLRDGLQKAQAEGRMLVVVGGSAGGKSRSAAEAARLLLPDHRLLCPSQTALARVNELPVADRGPAVAWLDDAELYEERAFKDSVEWLLRSGVVVVATIRRTELENKMPQGDLRNPLGEALTDRELTVRVSWPVIWNDEERARVGEHVSDRALLAWVAAGNSPSAWVVAGPALQDRLSVAEGDEDRPVRYAVVRTVLDWYRTGIAQPVPAAFLPDLLWSYLSRDPDPAELKKALKWAFKSVTGASRSTSQSLLAKTPTGDAITIHDYIQDADASSGDRTVADVVWRAALAVATPDARFAIGLAANRQANPYIARKAWLRLAVEGDVKSMNNVGIVLKDSDTDHARYWFQKAAEAGDTAAMSNLGVLLADSDPGQARHWYEKAAEAGAATPMFNLGRLLLDSDPGQARRWFEKAAEAGDADAMYSLGWLLKDSDPGQARHWWEEAAEAGYPGAIYNLGVLLASIDPGEARDWFEKAAEAGHADAMYGLGLLLKDSDPGQARHWWEEAAEAGYPAAMYSLGVLFEESDPGQSRRWYEKGAEAGNSDAMFNLGVLLLKDGDPGQARHWFEKAAEAGDATAMFNLGALLADSDPDQARHWIEKAAQAGHPAAM
jgi:TPR repeat protein